MFGPGVSWGTDGLTRLCAHVHMLSQPAQTGRPCSQQQAPDSHCAAGVTLSFNDNPHPPTCVNLLLSAGLSSFLPKSPPGFIVASTKNPGAPTTSSAPAPPFSASVRLRPGSSTLRAGQCFNR